MNVWTLKGLSTDTSGAVDILEPLFASMRLVVSLRVRILNNTAMHFNAYP